MELPTAFSKRPSFLKRQKEQQRLAKATEKREARRARKHSKESQGDQTDSLDPSIDSPEGVDDGLPEEEDAPERAEE